MVQSSYKQRGQLKEATVATFKAQRVATVATFKAQKVATLKNARGGDSACPRHPLIVLVTRRI